MNHDIEDAMAAGVLHACDIPREITQALGETKSQRITSLIAAVVAHGPEHIGMAPEWQAAYDALHAFMYSTVYAVSYTHLRAACMRRARGAGRHGKRRPRRLCGGRLVLCRYHARAIIILAAL